MKYALLIGRILFSLIFIMAGLNHFSAAAIQHSASLGIPMASVLVPITGIMCLFGGLSVALGYKTKIGALVLVAFLLPVTFIMHQFWNIPDAMMQQMDMAMFMKNIALTGSALALAYFGAGPLSLDARKVTQ